MLDSAFDTWTRCSTADMLALKVLNTQVAPFQPNPTLKNYSWLEQHHGSPVPFNVSEACTYPFFKEGELDPLSELQRRSVAGRQ